QVHHQWSWRKRRRRRRRQEEAGDGKREDIEKIEEKDGGKWKEEEQIPSTSRGEEETSSFTSHLREEYERDQSYAYTGERNDSQNVHDGRSYPHERISEQKSTYTRHQRYHSPRGGGLFSLFSSLLPSLLFLLLFCFLPPPVIGQDCSWTKNPWSAFSPAPTLPTMGNSAAFTPSCFPWSSDIPSVICEVKGDQRRKRMGMVHLLYGDNETSVTIYDMLLANSSGRSSTRLRPGINGRDCFDDDVQKCRACFRRIDDSMQRLSSARSSFERALNRFDCLPAVDTASATRPFSPNASCLVCKMWYKRWLASQLLDIWSERPCVDWCYSAQLACPHLATSRVVDYAGHPSFQCTDLNIPLTNSSPCSCIHPCDISGIVTADLSLATSDMCSRRLKLCSRPSSSSSSPSISPFLPLLILSLALSSQYSTT
ncbi:hypothetical protein PFISCL1PPCAC_23974, partial [Pristionchus fissidentatus]